MNSISITMGQILALSDLNKFFQFIYLNQYWFYGATLLAIFLSAIFEKRIVKPKRIVIPFCLLSIGVFGAVAHANSTALNENQIKLIKSINDPQFQSDALNSVEEHGANIYAISGLLKPVVNNSYKEKLDSIEFYKRVQP